jgi:hypothetical protein
MSVLGASAAFATDAGLRQYTVANSPAEAGPISVALYYPRQAQGGRSPSGRSRSMSRSRDRSTPGSLV